MDIREPDYRYEFSLGNYDYYSVLGKTMDDQLCEVYFKRRTYSGAKYIQIRVPEYFDNLKQFLQIALKIGFLIETKRRGSKIWIQEQEPCWNFEEYKYRLAISEEHVKACASNFDKALKNYIKNRSTQ